MLKKFITLGILFTFMSTSIAQSEIVTRIKDISRINGIRNNQLIGYGLIVGLEGTGDSSSKVAARSIANFLNSFGVKIDQASMKGKNIAAVSVTAIIPPFAKKGDQIDITVSSIGDAKSLQGGMLLLTPLKAPNGKIYAVAQGPVSIGGFNESAGGSSARKNHSTIGRIPNGAIMEKDIYSDFLSQYNTFQIILRNHDFSTATSVAEQINLYFNENLAQVKDPSTIEVYVPEDFRDYLMLYVARIEQLPIVPDSAAKIVINERTGTILMGGPVKIMPVAVAHGNLNISVKENNNVSQPPALSGGNTETIQNSDITVSEQKSRLLSLPETNSINDVVKVLNTIGATPRDMISILQSMKNAGALQAEVEIQ